MRSATIVLIGCALVSFVSPEGVLAEGAMRIDELKEIVKAVEVEAEAWARSAYTGGKVTHRIRNVWYDQGSIGPLRTVLEIPREKPNELFVACRIISPMINAKAPVIAEALNMIHPIADRLAVYRELTTYTEAQLEAMAPAEDASKILKDRASKLRAEKRKDDLDVQKHNGQVRALRAIVYRMMVRSRNRDQDTLLLKALVASEKNADWMYADILGVIQSEARKMSEARGKVVYAALREFWNELRVVEGSGKKTYVDKGTVEIVVESNSKFATHSDVAKKRLLKVINHVATAGKMPALRDPRYKKTKKKKTSTKKTNKRTKK
jgi:hypothetical protein